MNDEVLTTTFTQKTNFQRSSVLSKFLLTYNLHMRKHYYTNKFVWQ